jgi:hypothetical protein
VANTPIDLEAYRSRRLAALSRTADPRPCHLSAAPDRVLLLFTTGAELDLSPAHARVWAERLAAMADVAEALGRDERALLSRGEEGGPDAS